MFPAPIIPTRQTTLGIPCTLRETGPRDSVTGNCRILAGPTPPHDPHIVGRQLLSAELLEVRMYGKFAAFDGPGGALVLAHPANGQLEPGPVQEPGMVGTAEPIVVRQAAPPVPAPLRRRKADEVRGRDPPVNRCKVVTRIETMDSQPPGVENPGRLGV